MQLTRRLAPTIAAVVGIAAAVPWTNLSAAEPRPTPAELSAAILRAIPLIEAGSAGSAEHRTCFTCHSQAVPILALAAARQRGFAVDEANLDRQVLHTRKHLERGRQGYLEGRGQGGRVLTAGYALWALDAGGEKPNDLTAAVTGYLLAHQRPAKSWSQASKRPPSAGSPFTNTYVALRAFATFGTPMQQPEIAVRKKRVQPWLLDTTAADTEDRVFRLRALTLVDGPAETVQTAAAELIATQQDDGGWAQNDEMESDAYATATALVALLQDARLSSEHAAVRRGIGYLLDTQLADGSWHVATRAKGFQTHFETGFPHGKDQFISTAGSAWSLLALMLVLPEEKLPEEKLSEEKLPQETEGRGQGQTLSSGSGLVTAAR